jgi:hypothetical protein
MFNEKIGGATTERPRIKKLMGELAAGNAAVSHRLIVRAAVQC